jgi:hypothetical protein
MLSVVIHSQGLHGKPFVMKNQPSLSRLGIRNVRSPYFISFHYVFQMNRKVHYTN